MKVSGEHNAPNPSHYCDVKHERICPVKTADGTEASIQVCHGTGWQHGPQPAEEPPRHVRIHETLQQEECQAGYRGCENHVSPSPCFYWILNKHCGFYADY